jgi:hypothetical protein
MAALKQEQILEMAHKFIDEQFPTPLGNKKNWELKDQRAVELTLAFIAGFSAGYTNSSINSTKIY